MRSTENKEKTEAVNTAGNMAGYRNRNTEEASGEGKNITKPGIREEVKKTIACIAYTLCCLYCSTTAAFATTEAVTAPFTNLQSLAGSIVSAIGYIITLFGISEWGVSFGEAQGVMQSQALKRIGGGFIMILAPQILTILTS